MNGGTCGTTGTVYTCSCPTGWGGTNCNIYVASGCVSNTCLNAGVCYVQENGEHVCVCQDGFKGSNCETVANPAVCTADTCKHNGACHAVGDETLTYLCKCSPEWRGTNCEISVLIPPCDSNPCQNDGTCAETSEGFSCICREGYGGTACETDINECLSDPCQNGGSCYDKTFGYTCICSDMYTGPHCEDEYAYLSGSPIAVHSPGVMLISFILITIFLR
uniref:Delta-like protein C-like n=1 Tax=Saccoglossus kowalevskii TaxID=10224 RepID=A0ABM0MD26_SACKO|nr:PREDICTED: delta-like protein C-like [Saccoglossus kowalevskii]